MKNGGETVVCPLGVQTQRNAVKTRAAIQAAGHARTG